MLTVGLLIGGALASLGLWWAMRAVFGQRLFLRENYRGVSVPVGAGVLIGLAVVAVEAVHSVVNLFARRSNTGWINYAPSEDLFPLGDWQRDLAISLTDLRLLALAVVVGFGLLGLFDDLAGTNAEKGFRGHIRAMARGRLTTGGAKLVLGGLVAVVAASRIDASAPGAMLVDVPLIALAANLGNLFDRAPGRTIKVGTLCALPLLLMGASGQIVAATVGAALGLLLFDLREDLMLGDAGANAIGAVLGLGVVVSGSLPARLAVLGVLLALNLASEKVSFSKVIDRTPPLRWLDRLGRRPIDPAGPATG